MAFVLVLLPWRVSGHDKSKRGSCAELRAHLPQPEVLVYRLLDCCLPNTSSAVVSFVHMQVSLTSPVEVSRGLFEVGLLSETFS